jgi:hypothetical protein
MQPEAPSIKILMMVSLKLCRSQVAVAARRVRLRVMATLHALMGPRTPLRDHANEGRQAG